MEVILRVMSAKLVCGGGKHGSNSESVVCETGVFKQAYILSKKSDSLGQTLYLYLSLSLLNYCDSSFSS